LICDKDDAQKPMCFHAEPWCCELHRKQAIAGGLVKLTMRKGKAKK
jgi:hypothetical protein